MLEIRRYDEAAKRALADARGILDRADQEGRELTAEEEQRFQELHAEAERSVAMRERLKDQERAEARDLEKRELERRRREKAARQGKGDPDQAKRDYKRAFDSWLRHGPAGMPVEQRSILARGFQTLEGGSLDVGGFSDEYEQRVMTGNTAGTPYGGYVVPQEFMAQVEKAMVAYAAILAAADIFDTATGATLYWPTTDDTSNEGELLSETSGTGEATAGDVVMGRAQFDSYTLGSKIVKVQRQLLQDSGVNLDAVLADCLGERLGRGMATYCTTGTGTSQPNGVVTAAADSSVDFSIGTPTWTEPIDLVHSVDPAYRTSPKFGLMMNDTSLSRWRKLADTNGDPIWNPGGAGFERGAMPTISGFPYWVNQKMAAPTGTNKAYLAGDFSKFKIRRVLPPLMLRLEERYAEFLQVGFLMFLRFDSELISANAVKFANMTT